MFDNSTLKLQKEVAFFLKIFRLKNYYTILTMFTHNLVPTGTNDARTSRSLVTSFAILPAND